MADSADSLKSDVTLAAQIAELDNRVHMATGLLQLLEAEPEKFQAALLSGSCNDQILRTQGSRRKLLVRRQLLRAELEKLRRTA